MPFPRAGLDRRWAAANRSFMRGKRFPVWFRSCATVHFGRRQAALIARRAILSDAPSHVLTIVRTFST